MHYGQESQSKGAAPTVHNEWINETAGNLHIHVFPTKKYKTVSVLAQVEQPLIRQTVTATALLPQILVRGTKQYPVTETLTQAFDELYGAGLSARANKHGDVQTIEFTLQVAGEEFIHGASGLFKQAMQLFGQVICEPYVQQSGFLASYVETEKALHQQRIENLINDKIAYAMERCAQIMYANDAYGISRFGYVEDLQTLTPISLYESYQKLVLQGSLHVYVVGPVDEQAVKEQLLSVFEHFTKHSGAQGVTMFMTRSVPEATQAKYIEEAMDVNQGKLNMGLRTGFAFPDDEYAALLVYNGILGGFPHSKLFLEVREKESLAYYASSRLEGLKGSIFIQSGIEIANKDRTQEIIEKQLLAMKRGDITQDEMRFTKDGLLNQYLQSDDHPFTGAMLHMFGRMTDRRRSVEDLVRDIEQVSMDDVVRVAQTVNLDTTYFLRDKEV